VFAYRPTKVPRCRMGKSCNRMPATSNTFLIRHANGRFPSIDAYGIESLAPQLIGLPTPFFVIALIAFGTRITVRTRNNRLGIDDLFLAASVVSNVQLPDSLEGPRKLIEMACSYPQLRTTLRTLLTLPLEPSDNISNMSHPALSCFTSDLRWL
jgi:hypothetical protein